MSSNETLAQFLVGVGRKLDRKLWDSGTLRLLDFGCGKGLVSRALAPYTSQLVGIDVNKESVAAFNRSCFDQGLDESEMHAYELDIFAPEAPSRFADQFDVVVSTVAFHHIQNFPKAVKLLVETLKPGGYLLVAEMNRGHFAHAHADFLRKHGVKHVDLKPEALERAFTDAGLIDVADYSEKTILMWAPAHVELPESWLTSKTRCVHNEDQKEFRATVYIVSGRKPA